MNILNIKSALVTLTLLSLSQISHSAKITVNVDNIQSDKGAIYVQIFKGAENYKKGTAATGQKIVAKKGPLTINFPNLTAGEYAVRLFHDENGNGKVDSNMFGIPTEGFSYSNEAKANYGPAKYEDMKVTLKEGQETLITKAKMQY